MGQKPIESQCPMCGARNRMACYGVVAHKREDCTVRYYLCRKCGARVSRKYYDTMVDGASLPHSPASPCDFRQVTACKSGGADTTPKQTVNRHLVLAF